MEGEYRSTNHLPKAKRAKLALTLLVFLLFLTVAIVIYYRMANQESILNNNNSQSSSDQSNKKNFDSKDATPTSSTVDNVDTTTPATITTPAKTTTSPVDDHDAYYYYNLGEREFGLKNYSGAIDNYNLAIAKDPKQESYYSRKAEAQVYLNQRDQAIATVEAGLVQIPNSQLLINKLDILKTIVK